jgi:hypothetical protein
MKCSFWEAEGIVNMAVGDMENGTALVEAVARATVDHRHTTKRTTCPSSRTVQGIGNLKGTEKQRN